MEWFPLLMVLLLQLTFVYGSEVNPQFWCRDPAWKLIDNVCVKEFTHSSMSWYDARTWCRDFTNGDLVEIYTDKMHHAVNGELLRERWYWIGASDSDVEGHFVFGSGHSMSRYQPWRSGEPNNYKYDEDCVSMRGGYGEWNDNNCSRSAAFVCQTDALQIPVYPDTAPNRTHCPSKEWRLVGEKCVMAVEDQAMTWHNARNACIEIGGTGADLVQIENKYENYIVTGLFKTNVPHWIGVRDENKDRVFKYVDGHPLSYFQPWCYDQPDNKGGSEYCVEAFTNGAWNDQDCSNTSPFVCQVDAHIPAEGTRCHSSDWTLVGNKCIKAFTHTERDWFGARALCKRYNNGDLVEIYGHDMLQAVNDQLRNNTWYWFGANDQIWEGHFYFSSGNPLSNVQPWLDGEPDDSKRNEDCAQMRGGDGVWNDNDCRKNAPFVCQADVQ